jgi:hypothetical protein
MANGPTEITAKIGTRLTEAEARMIDPEEIGRSQMQPGSFAVEGQERVEYVVCPYCGCVSAVRGDNPALYRYFSCPCCCVLFRA